MVRKSVSLVLEILHFSDRDVIKEIVLNRPEDDLHFDRDRIELRLLEDFHDAFAAFENALRLRVEVRTELRERCEFAELREIAFDATSDLVSSP